jgi:mRNA interferase MazF
MVTTRYIPDVGHVIWIHFDPQVGREQAGRRPALVLSPASYNGKTSLALLCPITSQAKGYPFEVPVKKTPGVTGVVLSDHIKCLDWSARKAEYQASAPTSLVESVRNNIALLIGIQMSATAQTKL